MKDRLEARRLTVNSSRGRLQAICDFIDEAADASGFDDRTSYACQLAVCEAVENTIQHGYRKRVSGKIRISAEVRPGELNVEIIDNAPAFDPSRVPVASRLSPRDPKVGGRGLLMIRRVMDAITYERRGDQNVLRLTKNRPFKGL